MIKFSSMRQYTHVVDGIMYPSNAENPYVIFYFSENSNFLEDKAKLKLRIQDFRTVVLPLSRIPRSILSSELRERYRDNKLIAIPSNQKIPSNRNIIVDMTQFLQKIDEVFHPTNYRTRAGNMVLSMVKTVLGMFPNNYQKIFMYTIDTAKDVPPFVDRKIYPILREMKAEDLTFDNMVFGNISAGEARFRLLIKDGTYKFERIWIFLRTVSGQMTEEETEEEVNDAAEKVMDDVKDHIEQDKPVVKSAIVKYLKSHPKDVEKIQSDEIDNYEKKKIAARSIIYNVSGSSTKASTMVAAIPNAKAGQAVRALDRNLTKEIIKQEDVRTLSTDPGVTTYSPMKMVDNKAPTHLFQKRQLDFAENLKKDIINSFKVLETKDVPIEFKDFKMIPKTTTNGEIDQTEISIVKVTLQDKLGNTHNVEIEIPTIDPKTGTFTLGGIRQCLINQIILCPIQFPVPGESKFESSYSRFRIYTKTARKIKYLDSFMICKMPLIFLMSYLFGFAETLKYYGITFHMSETRPKDEFSAKVADGKYVVFDKVTTEIQQQLVRGFLYGNPGQYDIKQEFPTKDYFEEFIIKMSGRVGTTYQISSVKDNIVDPVARQVLMNMQLPYELKTIMKYMSQKVVEGYHIQRNDLTNQRVRNSEVLVHLIQKQILASYTVYREQVLAGNSKAQLVVKPYEALSQFKQTELAVVMEFANPLEEMATMTRISPVGKKVSGIPDKRAIYPESRNIHPSYFGNIDPLDTPEGGNIGIVQQLAIDALLASSRGLIKQKPINDNEKAGMLSTTTCMTPFIENDDGARVIMIANQARQMLPLKNPQPPPVLSGYESILTNYLSDYFIKRAPCDGEVLQVTTDFIYIKCGGKKEAVNIMPGHLRSGSGKNTLSVFKPVVVPGTKVKKGDVIAEGACISDGSIATGRPLLAAVMPYMGYNFEDGLIISDRLVDKDLLTSLHAIEESILIEENDRLLYVAELGTMTKKGEPLVRKMFGNIEQLLGTSDDASEEIMAGQYIRKSPGGRIVDVEVFSNLPDSKFPKLKELIERTNRKSKKPAKEKYKMSGEIIKGVLIRFKIEQELRIGEGDKLCNRHGNKGIITKVEKHENMPKLPNGEHVDIVLNPVGIIGRMNIGQVYELYTGLISKELAVRITKMKTRNEIVTLIQKVYSKLDVSKNKKFTTTLIGGLKNLSDKNFRLMLQNVMKNGFYPIIIPPFSGPNYDNIKEALGVLGLKQGYKLFLPELNTYTMRDVPVGYMYIAKLEHLGDNKIFARSTGPVTGKTAQPTAGKRREGGQKVGELDTYAFISYNCPAVLAELMGPLSDDYSTKEEILSDIINDGHAEYRPAKVAPAKDLLNAYFIALMLERG